MEIKEFIYNKVKIQNISDNLLVKNRITLSILRADNIHHELSGNKWFKLKYNLLNARNNKFKVILSFGGAWSNHLYALAAAGKLFGFTTIGIVRGEEVDTPCLSDAQAHGMIIHRVSRAQYRDKTNPAFINQLHQQYGEFYLIPEGGGNAAGIKGCGEMVSPEQAAKYDYLCLACGTGSTLTGLVCGQNTEVLGFQVLKGEGYLSDQVNHFINQYDLPVKAQWSVNDAYHCGGYARSNDELLSFMRFFEAHHFLPIEPVYSGKMLFGIYDLIKRSFFKEGTKILAIHGGGLQGRRGFVP